MRWVHFDHTLERAARKFGYRTFLVCGDETRSYAELNERASRLAGALLGGGLAEGDRVAIVMRNTVEHVEATFGIARAGLIAVPVNRRLSRREIAVILNDCAAAFLIYETGVGDLAALGDDVGSLLGAFVVDGSPEPSPRDADGAERYEAALASAQVAPPRTGVCGDSVQAIHYTSGTTGTPKGVVRSHDANFAVASAGGQRLPMRPDDAWYTVLPFNSAAYYGMVLPPMEVGARFVMDREFDPAATLESLDSARVTHALLVPTMWEMMIRDPGHSDVSLSALRHPLWGGSTSTQGLIERLADWLPHAPLSGYGLTEAPFVTYSSPDTYASGRWDASGSPVSTIEIRVIDDDGAELPTREYGEVQLRGPLMMDGYLGRPELTAGVLGGDGWFSTGDWGRLDPDGVLTVADRKKDMIISGGENIYPAELENVISMLPGVAQVAVVGLPNELWGQEVCAVVLRTDDALGPDDVVAHCLEHLASFKKPRRVEFRDELPMTATGKVLKHELVSSLRAVEGADGP